MKGFRIERLNNHHFVGFHKLFCEVFNSEINLLDFQKKYDTKYLGKEYHYIGFIALDNNEEVVSYSGGIPFKFNFNEKYYIGLHSCDHLTRKDARKKGLFSQLNKAVDELCVKLKIPFLYGIPNQNNMPILVKHNEWEINAQLQVFEIPIITLPLSALMSRINRLDKYYKKYLKNRMATYKSSDPILQDVSGRVVKDHLFYKYKSFTSNYSLKFNSGLVWLKITSVIYIGEISLNPGFALTNLIYELKKFAFKCGLHKIIYIGSRNNELTQEFMKIYQPVNGNYVGGKIFIQNLNFGLVDIKYSLGDYDTF